MRDIDRNCVAAVVAYVGWLVTLLHIYASWIEREIQSPRTEREEVRKIQTDERSRDILRMGSNTFGHLVNILRATGLLRDTNYSCIEEQVMKFLHILSHNVRNRTISFFFRRSGETVSRHFHQVLRALISLEDRFLVQPNGNTIPQEILHNSGKFYPYFQDCIGALDGTHIRVKVSIEDVPRYRGRKGYPTMNVLAACTFDLKFTYVLPGWEGSASDSRVLEDSLHREDSLRVPPDMDSMVGEFDPSAEHQTNSVDQKTNKNYSKWNTRMDLMLLEVLEEQKLKGEKQDKNFTDETYKAVAIAVNTEFGLNMKWAHIQNRLKTLKSHMALVIDMLKQSGFSWNDITKTIEAEPGVWNEAVKGKPQRSLIRGKQLYHLDLMRGIFENDRANGSRAESAKEKVKRWQKEGHGLCTEDVDCDDTINVESFNPLEGSESFSGEVPMPSIDSHSKQPTMRKGGTKRKAPMAEIINEGVKISK